MDLVELREALVVRVELDACLHGARGGVEGRGGRRAQSAIVVAVVQVGHGAAGEGERRRACSQLSE